MKRFTTEAETLNHRAKNKTRTSELQLRAELTGDSSETDTRHLSSRCADPTLHPVSVYVGPHAGGQEEFLLFLLGAAAEFSSAAVQVSQSVFNSVGYCGRTETSLFILLFTQRH